MKIYHMGLGLGVCLGLSTLTRAQDPPAAPYFLSCVPTDGTWTVGLSWVNGATYDYITIIRDNIPLNPALPGCPTWYTDTVPGPGSYSYQVYGILGSQDSEPSLPCGPVEVTYVPPVKNLQCDIDDGAVAHLTWDSVDTTALYDGIDVSIDDRQVPESPLDGSAIDYTSEPLETGWHLFSVQPFILGLDKSYRADAALCQAECLVQAVPFIRGDVDGTDSIDLTDPILLLNHLFLGGKALDCLDAADADDTGELDINDVVYSLNWQFLAGDRPKSPFSKCGIEQGTDALDCMSFPACQ